MSELRTLKFDSLEQAWQEVQRLRDTDYIQRGNWNLGQICRHLYLVQDASVDGYPRWMSAFAFVRPLMKRLLLPRVLAGNSPKGIRTFSRFLPKDVSADEEECRRFELSIRRFQNHEGEYSPHPAFGRMDRQAFEAVHAAHAAHHLRFLEPSQNS